MDARRRFVLSGTAGYLRALWGHECEAVAICSVTLGLRRGEACGLRWSDIDLRTGEVRIRRSRQVVHGQEVVVAPKTERSARSCWLPRFAVRRLRALRTSMTESRHTWATLAVEAGVGIETVALMLGHTDISTAYEHYIVPRARVCRDAQKQVEQLIMRA